MLTRLVLAAAATLIAGAANANLVTTNLVANGDFESGNTGFTSAYSYTAPGPNSLYGTGSYTVDINPQNSHTEFLSYGDHTSGSGNFMIVNGAGEPGVAVWSTGPIAVSAGTYSFTAWLSSVYPESPAMLDFLISPLLPSFARASVTDEPLSIGTFEAPATTGQWSLAGGSFTVGEGVSFVTLSILNQNTALSGNDFGIDDINLVRTTTAVPEPATWGLMIAGFGLVGFAARRRRTTVTA